jgi:hypothetical protein
VGLKPPYAISVSISNWHSLDLDHQLRTKKQGAGAHAHYFNSKRSTPLCLFPSRKPRTRAASGYQRPLRDQRGRGIGHHSPPGSRGELGWAWYWPPFAPHVPLGLMTGDPDRHRSWLLCPSSVPAAGGCRAAGG